MNVEELHNFAMNLHYVESSQPFGPDNIVYKVHNKMFLLVDLDSHPTSINVKCNPDLAIALREEYECILPGYHMNKKHWNTIKIDGSVSTKKMKEMIMHSYKLVCASKKK
jgi:predicted DNA-binding protein (MmcQ/YjbR family)